MEFGFGKELFPRSIQTNVGKASNLGMVRAANEDSLLTLELFLDGGSRGSLGLYAVADGVGGYEGGEIASDLALRTLAESVVRHLVLLGPQGEPPGFDQEFILGALAEGVKTANGAVRAQSLVKGNGMGTTLATVLIVGTTAYIANVGDSRVYLLDSERFRQVTVDHSLVAELVAAGEIAPDEIYTHPRRNIITRCLGPQRNIKVDLFTEALKPGSSLLLCSDGLWEMVRDNEIKDVVLKAESPQAACDQLVELANQNGGVDNISVIVVKATR